MSNIEWILIIITIFLVILLFRYIQLKKQIRNLADQVNEFWKFTADVRHFVD